MAKKKKKLNTRFDLGKQIKTVTLIHPLKSNSVKGGKKISKKRFKEEKQNTKIPKERKSQFQLVCVVSKPPVVIYWRSFNS